MEKEFYIELIYKSFSGEISAEEQNQLQNWLSHSEENQKEANALQKVWALSADFTKDIKVNLDTDFAQLQNRIEADEKENVKEAVVRTMPIKKKNNWWKPLSVAAAVLFLAGAFFLFNQTPDAVEMLAMETIEGQVKEITLADGSQVWLNGDSKLTYPNSMNGEERRVELTGEAFFDITKNPNKPFIINTRDAEVKVLGTSFEVRAIDDEIRTEVVVKTGKVSLGKKNDLKPLILEPNEKGVYNKDTGKKFKSNVRNLNTISWQSKTLDFDDVLLEKAIVDIEKHFGIQVTLDNQDLLNCKFGGIFINPKHKDILKTISDVFKMKLVQEDERKFKLEGGKCTTEQSDE